MSSLAEILARHRAGDRAATDELVAEFTPFVDEMSATLIRQNPKINPNEIKYQTRFDAWEVIRRYKSNKKAASTLKKSIRDELNQTIKHILKETTPHIEPKQQDKRKAKEIAKVAAETGIDPQQLWPNANEVQRNARPIRQRRPTTDEPIDELTDDDTPDVPSGMDGYIAETRESSTMREEQLEALLSVCRTDRERRIISSLLDNNLNFAATIGDFHGLTFTDLMDLFKKLNSRLRT